MKALNADMRAPCAALPKAYAIGQLAYFITTANLGANGESGSCGLRCTHPVTRQLYSTIFTTLFTYLHLSCLSLDSSSDSETLKQSCCIPLMTERSDDG